MIKRVCFYISLFFLLIINIVIAVNIEKYFQVLKQCFEEDIILTSKIYILICSIIAVISIFIVLDVILVFKKKKDENKGIKFKEEDGTYGTSNWMSEKEMQQVLSFDKPGIILGKYNNKFVKLPFESYFNKNICVFGSSRKYENNRICFNKYFRIIIT